MYLTSSAVKKRFTFSRGIAAIVLSTFALMSISAAALSFHAVETANAETSRSSSVRSDIGHWLICDVWGFSEPIRFIAEFATTDNINYEFFSKSVATSGISNVDDFLNQLISIGNAKSFSEVNQEILGVNLKTGKPEGTYNSGTSVTVFDRFGVAGLNWTRYNGEWKFTHVDYCTTAKTEYSLVHYEDRLEPRSTFSGREKSRDVRTQRVNDNGITLLGEGILNTTANWIFAVTKGVVAVSLGIVNLSLVDFVSLAGVGDLIASEDGVFRTLFDNFYTPFIVVAIAIATLSILWRAFAKREFRGALGVLGRSLALFIIAIVVSVYPLFFISLPNNIATVGQATLISALGPSMAQGSGICSSGLATDEVAVVNAEAGIDVSKSQDILSQASSTMRSVIGCQVWSTFLLKPWALGQFGADFSKLYAEGYIPASAHEGSDFLRIDNEEMVGNAAVPMGGGIFIHNWALFHISATTNVHANYNMDPEAPELSGYNNGVANDWFRIVDALANYNEVETEIWDSEVRAANNPAAIDSIVFMTPDLSKEPTVYWDSWVGGNSSERVGIALTSILGAFAGLFTVLIFAFLGVIYGFGITILMAFAPIFLLLGSSTNSGWEAFKSWGQLVLNLMMKRILIGFILVLNLVILTTVLNLMEDRDYFWGVAVMAIISFMLFSFRQKITDTVGGLFSFNFSNSNLDSITGETLGKLKRGARVGGDAALNITAAGVAGGFAAKRFGGSIAGSAASSMSNELKNQILRSNNSMVRHGILANQALGGKTVDEFDICVGCGESIAAELDNGSGSVVVDESYNYWHIRCAYEVHEVLPSDWNEITVHSDASGKVKKKPIRVKKIKSVFDEISEQHLIKQLESLGVDSLAPGSDGASYKLGQAFYADIENQGDTGVAQIPTALAPYVSQVDKDKFEELIRRGHPEHIEQAMLILAQAMLDYAITQASDHKFDKPTSTREEVYAEMLRGFKNGATD